MDSNFWSRIETGLEWDGPPDFSAAFPERGGRPLGFACVTEIEPPTIRALYGIHQLAISVQGVVITGQTRVRRFSCSKPGEESMEQPLRRQWVEAHACITSSEPPWPAARLQHRAVRCSEATAKREKLAFGENRVDLSCGGSVLNKTRTVMRDSCSRQVRVGQKGKHPS